MGEWVRPQYSHGWLVPVFTAVLLAMRHEPFQKVTNSVRWWGMAIMSAGMALRLLGSYFQIHTFDNVSIIPVLMGAFVVVGGWPALRWSAAPLGFLVFMLPLPTELQRMVLVRMQHWAAVMSNYSLQTIGVDSYLAGADGNTILVGENGIPLNVQEACSGLRMATIFIAMAVALTMILDRPWWEKTLIIVSAIPIAVAVNVIRIVVTALLFMVLGQDSEFAKHFFHDLAGLFMMPIALGFMYVEMQILDHAFIEEETRVLPHTTGFGPAPTARRQTPTRVP
jgi:exosortase